MNYFSIYLHDFLSASDIWLSIYFGLLNLRAFYLFRNCFLKRKLHSNLDLEIRSLLQASLQRFDPFFKRFHFGCMFHVIVKLVEDKRVRVRCPRTLVFTHVRSLPQNKQSWWKKKKTLRKNNNLCAVWFSSVSGFVLQLQHFLSWPSLSLGRSLTLGEKENFYSRFFCPCFKCVMKLRNVRLNCRELLSSKESVLWKYSYSLQTLRTMIHFVTSNVNTCLPVYARVWVCICVYAGIYNVYVCTYVCVSVYVSLIRLFFL